MFYRRKLLLALLEALGRTVPKVDFQKYAFLVCLAEDKPAYEFVPYRFGCYSFRLDADKRTLAKYGLLRAEEQWALNGNKGYMDQLNPRDRQIIVNVVNEVGEVRGRDLIGYVYRRYPYYAINSEILDEILGPTDREIVEASRPVPRSARLFTIGYEGKSLERYLNQLIIQTITVLCDIRRNPVSRKYGFSKRQLQGAVEGLGIRYVHLPELGVASYQRKRLHSLMDYRTFFDHYVETTLKQCDGRLAQIVDLIQGFGRVALTCFEADHNYCHRYRVATALQERPGFHHRVVHL